ncbi:MAG: Bax inhibitor-1/YccA family protein [Dactylosporangium sp.]|nr:Bax inhibitor-1/YccA family protein [Dactylosporangium sp.]NNJ61772.1 Bax inhibitor-1/YccA family protein [Dactylosporangium sp.]
MKTSNPVLTRIGATAQQPHYQGHSYETPIRGQYQPQVAWPGDADVMTIDDVVIKTVSLIGATVLSAALTFALMPDALLGAAWISAAIIGLVLGLAISFAQLTNPVLMFAYAVVEGVLLGAVSKFYESFYDGIVIQAVVATMGTFFVMAALYKMRVIRATPGFMRVVIGLMGGLFVVMLINFAITLFTGSPTILRDGGPIAIGFSLICITVAALMFVVSFRQIEDGVAARLPRKYGWLGAFGILVELVWLYLEMLRFISYFSED